MMRRIRSWWALLAMTTMVLASLMVPLRGAAYPIPDQPGPIEGGDPDNPSSGIGVLPAKPQPYPAMVTAYISYPILGTTIVLRVPIPASLIHWIVRRAR